jgi:hypothetical protein
LFRLAVGGGQQGAGRLDLAQLALEDEQLIGLVLRPVAE